MTDKDCYYPSWTEQNMLRGSHQFDPDNFCIYCGIKDSSDQDNADDAQISCLKPEQDEPQTEEEQV